MTPLERFIAKCRFEPRTGCVRWIGGKTSGRGNTALYGSFWFEGRRWFAHRWAAAYIHGLADRRPTGRSLLPAHAGRPPRYAMCGARPRRDTD